MTMLYRIAERVLNRPLLVHKDKIPLILSVLEGRIPVEIPEKELVGINTFPETLEIANQILRGPAPPAASQFVGSNQVADPVTGRVEKLPYRMQDSTAIIGVFGSLVNRGAWLGSSSGETSYEGLQFQINHAAANPRVKGIVLDIESPGGEAVGAFETADVVRAAASKKPVVASVNGMAASAAYAIASGANKIFTAPTGVLGSIGVVLLHADYSRALEKKGITTTLIFAGAHKVDGNPFQPLPDGVRADLQAEVNKFYDMFVQTVAAGRQGLAADAIMSMEAQTFIGEDAVKQKLADAVGSFTDAMSAVQPRGFVGRIAPTLSNKRKQIMSDTLNGDPAAEIAGNTVTVFTTPAQVEASIDAAAAVARTAGANAVYEKFAAILGSDKIKGREAVALSLAVKSNDMSADDVIAFVASLPKQAAAPTIEQRMGGQGAALAMGGPIAPIQSQSQQRVPNAADIYAKRNAQMHKH